MGEGIEEKKTKDVGDISGLFFFLNTQQTHDKWWGFGGLEERKIELGYLRIRREVLTTPSSLYNSSLVIRKKGRGKEEKKKTQEMKSKVRTNHFLIVIRFPPQSAIPRSSAPPFISIQHSHESHRIATLKITWVIFCFSFVCNLEVHDNNSSAKHPMHPSFLSLFFFCS